MVRLKTSDGKIADQISIDTPVRAPPPWIVEERLGQGEIDWVIKPENRTSSIVDGGIGPLVGGLPCVSRARSFTRGFAPVQYLQIPPPAPFSLHDVEAMWKAACRLPGRAAASMLGQGFTKHASVERIGRTFQPIYLPAALAAARRLLGRWPQREGTEIVWRPLEVAGGREDQWRTLQSPKAYSDAWGKPTQTARRRATTNPWRSRSVNEVSSALESKLLESRFDIDDDVMAIADLREIQSLSAAPRSSLELPLSSWPQELRTFYELALLALTEVSAYGAGLQSAPLCKLWELYESWVLSELVTTVSNKTEIPPTHTPQLIGWSGRKNSQPSSPTWWAAWETGGARWDLWAQLCIGRNGPKAFNKDEDTWTRSGAGLLDLQAVTSDLIPDALLRIQFADGTQKTIVVDAKLRSRPMMSKGDAGDAGAKYLWGLRIPDSPVLGLDEVHLITTSEAVHLHDRFRAQITVSQGTPSHGMSLNTILGGL